ncbi:hypothetical protein [Fischerella thermalis]|uniref:Uncharacterized protein n=1 Tax=Fischerella thermalis CCMEE 5318 TaxID=2019666 RepID=A0A2N6LBW6_9CYAN|nr:hypothetical protein [Fischerella thermalis]PMB20269.1 hypothetical protein CEN46_16805 [Fischerella thermalis CCMEE 5318]
MVLAVSTIPQQSLPSEGFSLFEIGTTAYVQFARWLKQQQQTMKPKAFKALLAEYGMIRREATKFIKLATVSDRFVPEDLAKLGLMMFSLLTPRYAPLWSEMLDEGELTQDLVDGLKKQMFPTKKRENKKQSSVTPAAIDNQDTQARLETIASSEGISPQKAVDKALDYYEAFAQGRLVWAESKDLEETSAVAQAAIALEEDSVSFPKEVEEALVAEEVENKGTGSEGKQESLNSNSVFSPAEEAPLNIRVQSASERWREGWKVGDIVVANSTVEDFVKWSKGQPLQITFVSGRVGSVQRITVINSDFQEYSTFGNWIEPAPTYQVAGTTDDWEGEIVKINSIGRVYHRISAIDDQSRWTSIKHEFLTPIVDAQYQPIVSAGVQAKEDELEQFISSEEVALQQWGLSLGDTVVWSDDERLAMMAGRIYDVTLDQALVDCGLENPIAVAYSQLKKITPEYIESALGDPKSPHAQIFLKAKNVKKLWNVNSIVAAACLKELLNMTWHHKVWIDVDAMSEENRLLFIPGGKDYLDEKVGNTAVDETFPRKMGQGSLDSRNVLWINRGVSNPAPFFKEDSVHKEIPINPIEEIAKVFRNASDWAEIRTALLTYGYEHKQAAWNLLFKQEKQRFLSLMPPAVQKLSKLKKQGIILDFKEDMTGENFFIKLKSGTEQEVSIASFNEFILELEPF